MSRRTRRLSATALASVLGGFVLLPSADAQPAAPAQLATDPVSIDVLSTRADLVSSGDALVEIHRPEGTNPDSVRVELNGEDVVEAFAVRPDGRFIGLLEGLEAGDNHLFAAVHQHTAEITLTNHPTGGPIFSGPHLQPWICTTANNGLGEPLDDDCNAEPRVDFFYQSTSGGGLQAYDPANPPGDVNMTTTDEGETVPFIVRRERGAVNRGIYDVAVLFDPEQPWEPWDPQAGWNGKIVWPFGPAAGTLHSQGSPVSVLNTTRLGEGFMVATHSLNQHNINLNTVVSAESVMMLKEHITENYGEIRYVIGQGGSGASIQQQVIANTYPGLLDGILPAASFPDTYTTGGEVSMCIALNAFFPLGGFWGFLGGNRAQATGHQGTLTCTLWQITFAGPTNPTTGCGLPASVMYHPVNNPDGVRCTAQDYMVNIWGRRDEDGFAKRPGTSIGVQYALDGLLAGDVPAEAFLDLNDNIGSLDIDGNVVPGERFPADPETSQIAYRTGQVTDGEHLNQVPIIDLRGSENNGIHTNFHSWEVKERLIQAHGHADNHAIFFAPGGLPAAASAEGFALMDQWLAAIEADESDDPLDVKVVKHKPDGAVDACFVGGQKFTDQEFCLEQAPFFGAPLIAAGGPLANDSVECQLKPLNQSDYPDGTFTPEQWERMEEVFPTGVCDWDLPPVGKTPTVAWLSYADGPGGQPLGDPPQSIAGCVGESRGRGNAPSASCPGRPS